MIFVRKILELVFGNHRIQRQPNRIITDQQNDQRVKAYHIFSRTNSNSLAPIIGIEKKTTKVPTTIISQEYDEYFQTK